MTFIAIYVQRKRQGMIYHKETMSSCVDYKSLQHFINFLLKFNYVIKYWKIAEIIVSPK